MTNLRSLVLAAGVAMAFAPSVAHAKTAHSMADLKALISQSAFKEAYEHLGDIPPAQRNAEWVDIAAAACGGVLGTLDHGDSTPLAVIDQIDRDYPQVLKNPKYTKVRAELGIKGLNACLQNGYDGDTCIAFATRFADNSNGDPALLVKIAGEIRLGTNGAPAVPFFNRALAVAKDKAAVCKDEQAQLALISGLGMPEGKLATDAKTMMNTCWDVQKDKIIEEFDKDSAKGYVKQNVCPTLLAKKLLSGLQAKQCENIKK